MTWDAYQCSVDHTGVTITWNVNKTGYGHNEIIQFWYSYNGVPQPTCTTRYYHYGY